jgi:AraC-like DNA-binding protein
MRVAPGTLSVLAVRAIAAGAAKRGLAPAELCARFAIAPALLADVEARVPVSLVVALWTEVPALVGDDDFGLHVAELIAAAPQGLGGRLIAAAPTFGEGLRRLLRFERVFHDVRTSELTVSGDRAVLAHDTRGGLALPRHAAEFGWAFLVLLGRRTTGAQLVPLAVELRHPAPASTAEHVRLFGVAPRFGAAVDRLVLRRGDLDRAQHGADAALAEILEAHAQGLHQRLPATPDLLDRARAAIRDGLPDAAAVSAVARRLGLAPRTLQRRLADRGVTFQGLVDEVRRDLARQLLAAPATAVAEVAFALGFADQSAFHRAFVRWTGQTPGSWRRRLA